MGGSAGVPATFAEARGRAQRTIALEGAEVNPVCHTRLLDHGEVTPFAVVFLHGFTNCPQQFDALAQQYFDAGCNVLVPRYPYHGLADRLNRDQGRLRTSALLRLAEESVDIAGGLGRRVVVVGLSLGGVLAGWLAQRRGDVDLAVMIAPLLWTPLLPDPLRVPVGALARTLPSAFLWWDPRLREALEPPYGYPRFATRGFGAMLGVGHGLLADARREPPRAGAVVVVTNAADPGVDNPVTARLVQTWRGHGARIDTFEFAADLGLPHDLIDPGNPEANIGLVYPRLRELISERVAT